MSTGLTAREERILNPRPRRHHRPTYSLLEVRIGAAVVLLLAAIGAWVVWMGAHPDPSLFAEVAAHEAPPAAVERGPLPGDLTPTGWREGAPSRFDARNLYEKIDGRADFFLSRGFRALTFLSLASEATPGAAVDVEFYDMGSAENALGAFSGEKPPDMPSTGANGTQWYVARNALFLARGPYYVRVVGSDESEAVKAQLVHLRLALERGLAAGEKPWAHALFADALGLAADRIGFERENAFSFGFAKNVYVGLLPDGETEAFVAPAADEVAARALARKFEEGFLSYGDKETKAGVAWIKDRYLNAYARVAAEGAMVVGVRGASSIETAAQAFERLRAGVRALPAGVVARAARPEPGVPTEPAYE